MVQRTGDAVSEAFEFAPHTLSWANSTPFSIPTRARVAASPAMVGLEAIGAVARCASAYLDLKATWAQRERLRQVLPIEEARLAEQRDGLVELVRIAERELDNETKVTMHLAEMVTMSAHVCREICDGLASLRMAELPDVARIEGIEDDINVALHNLGRAAQNLNSVYQETKNG